MQAAQLQTFGAWLAQHDSIAQDRLWQRELSQISETEIQHFYARSGLRGKRKLAIEAMDRLQSALLLAAVEGQLPQEDMRIIGHEVPPDPFMVDQFVDGLVKMRPTRRAAALFALECRLDPAFVENLTWGAAFKSLHLLPDTAREALTAQARVRHVRLPYVFWEWKSPEVAMPIMGLQLEAEKAFDRTWPSLQVAFSDMLWISQREDAGAFRALVEEVAAGR